MGEDELQHRVWNCDESGFCTAVASEKSLAKCREKEVHETMGRTGRDYITILACGCADGTQFSLCRLQGQEPWGTMDEEWAASRLSLFSF